MEVLNPPAAPNPDEPVERLVRVPRMRERKHLPQSLIAHVRAPFRAGLPLDRGHRPERASR